MSRLRLLLALSLATASAVAAGAVSTSAQASTSHSQVATAAQALSFLNQQRRANGIPALKTLKQSYAAAWCPNEEHGPSGGETFRDWSSLVDWTATSGPWDEAPLHQQSLYEPGYTGFGFTVASPQSSCAGLGGYAARWSKPTFFAFTGTQGHAQTPVSENVRGEGPFAPQQKVGIHQGTVTGPNLILYALGFTSQPQWSSHPERDYPAIVSVSILGPAGTVPDVRVVNPSRLEGLVAPGTAFVIPRHPLEPQTTYHASVYWRLPATGQHAVQHFSFTTQSSLTPGA